MALLVFFKKNLETMLHKKRLEYLNQKLRGIIQYAYKNSAAFKNRMDSVALKPKDIQTIIDLGEIPVTKKPDLTEFQKKDSPFSGYEGARCRFS